MADGTGQHESTEPVSMLEWVDRIATDYELAWKGIKPPTIDDFLGNACGERRAALAEELFRIDRAYREQLLEDSASLTDTPQSNPAPADAYATVSCLDVAQLAATAEKCVEPKNDALGQEQARAEITVPGYEILGELGRGGMGVVYKARHLQLKRLAALKMILRGAHASGDQLARFRREAGAAARLQHPNIVHVYEVGEYKGLPYFALEFMDGGSLGRRLRTSPLPAREAAQLVATLAGAMQTAHEAGVIHRDLKPDNVLLTSSGICKITDFGLAKQLDDDSTKTESDAIIGTPNYMAPEQASSRAREIGPLSDVYALGAILYECLTGRPPFKAATPMDTLIQVRTEEPVPPRRLQPKVPRDLETICLKCLEKQPQRRYASAEALAKDLTRFLNREPILARRVRPWERAAKWVRRRPAAAALVGVLIAVGVALPIVGLKFYAQLAQRRLDIQIEVQGLQAQGHTAFDSKDWKRAKQLLDTALEKVQDEPALEDLRKKIQVDRDQMSERLKAFETSDRFNRELYDALFHAILANGENQTDRQTARKKVCAALQVVGFFAEGQDDFTTTPSFAEFTEDEKADIIPGSYDLLLTLAEIEARSAPQETGKEHAGSQAARTNLIPPARLPQQMTEDHRQQLRKALSLLDLAGRLGEQTRAIHLRRSRYLERLGQVDAAEEEKKLALTLVPTTALDHFLAGQDHYSHGELPQAIHEFRGAVEINAKDFWAHYFLGICYVMSDELQAAVESFTSCQSLRPEVIWIYLLRGFALGQIEDYAAAERDFERAERTLLLEPDLARRYVFYTNRGLTRVLQDERRDDGVKDLKEAVKLRPDKYEPLASLAEAYALGGRLDDGGGYLDQAITVAGRQLRAGDLEPEKLATLYYRRALLYVQRSSEATVRNLTETVQLVGDNEPFGALIRLAMPLSDRKAAGRDAREAALRDLAESARLAENDKKLQARVEADRGRVLHLLQRFDEALEAYDQAWKTDPKNVDVLRCQGDVLFIQGRYDEVVEAFTDYLDKDGAPLPTVFRQRGQAYAQLSEHPEAIADFTLALKAEPNDEEKLRLYLYRGQEYVTTKAFNLALLDFEEALRLDPQNADGYLGRAHARLELHEPLKAVADAAKVVEATPKEPRLWYQAARIHAQAAAQLQTEPGQAAVRSHLEDEAVRFLYAGFRLLPANELPAWRERMLKDKALDRVRFRVR
jgi:tetratricopeptide (TPR) repeat protein/tRNA A-37 threonylcarbamoyl transferase component Bud32